MRVAVLVYTCCGVPGLKAVLNMVGGASASVVVRIVGVVVVWRWRRVGVLLHGGHGDIEPVELHRYGGGGGASRERSPAPKCGAVLRNVAAVERAARWGRRRVSTVGGVQGRAGCCGRGGRAWGACWESCSSGCADART